MAVITAFCVKTFIPACQEVFLLKIHAGKVKYGG